MAADSKVRAMVEAALRATATQLGAGEGAERAVCAVCAVIQTSDHRGTASLLVPASLASATTAQLLERCLKVAGEAEGEPLLVSYCAPFAGPPLEDGHSVQVGRCRGVISLHPSPAPKVHITEILGEAQRLSETEVLAIGKDMQRVSQLAKHHADGLKEVSAQLSNSNANGQRTVATAISTLSERLRSFTAALLERTAQQRNDVAQARTWTTDIVRLGQSISDIASNARVLTFNARIESARIGEAGKGFAVIAQSIQELASMIRTTNESVSTLAHNLATALPRLGDEANVIASETTSAREIIDKQLEEVERALAETSESAGQALNQGIRDADELQQHTFAVLEHLQFQDRATQMLTDASEQVKKLLAYAQLAEIPPDRAQIEQVGKLGRQLEGKAALRPAGDVELF